MSESEKLHRQFLREKVNPLIEKMVVDVLVARPDNLVQYMIKWLQEKGDKTMASIHQPSNSKSNASLQSNKKPAVESDVESEEEDGEPMILLPAEQLAAAKKNKMARGSVSAEAFGSWNKKSDFKAKVIPKTEAASARIKKRMSQAFMFSNLDEREQEVVVLAMEEKKFNKGDIVIKQGDEGDMLYVVDSGELECYRKFKKDEEDRFLKKYQPGESFGELSLLYNAPRAATIIAGADECVCFALDRATFNHIVKDAAAKKRDAYEAFLSKVEILASMDPYERSQVADALKPVKVKAGEFVVKEGEKGTVFYIIEEGEAKAMKMKADGSQEVVFEYKPGDYFGELALIKESTRAASVVADTDMRLVSLEGESFKRLLGPLEDILKRNFSRYEKYLGL